MSAIIYLWINIIMYYGFSIWCFIQPQKTANFIGLNFLNNSGKSEYLAVYAGIELGLALFFTSALIKPELRFAGVLFGAFMYCGISVFRWYAILRFGSISATTYGIAFLELALAIWGVILISPAFSN